MFCLKVLRQRVMASIVSCTVAFFGLSAQAESFTGSGVVYDFSGCEAWITSTYSVVHVRLDASTTDGEPSHLTMFHPLGGGQNFVISQPLRRSNRWTRGRGTVVGADFYRMVPAPRTRIRHFSVRRPNNGNLANATDLRMTMQVRNYNGFAGCSATMSLVLAPRYF